jgi:hypothetical protein
MQQAKRQPRRTHRRAGLAPLELVLALPLMLFVMGLMIVFGTSAAWRVRTHTTAREAVWRTLWPRTGDRDPHPASWPQTASLSAEAADPAWLPFDPFADFPVVRGPLLVEPNSGKWLPVRQQMFDLPDGLVQGTAQIERDFPMMASMPPHEIAFLHRHPILDTSRWQFRTMGLPDNQVRRVQFLYPVQLEQHLPQEAERYTQAAVAILTNPMKWALAPLDRDEELRAHYGNYRDYYLPGDPLLRQYVRFPDRVCEMDPEALWEQVGEPLVLDIKGHPRPRTNLNQAGVPGRMAADFIGMYNSQLAQIDAQITALQQQLVIPGGNLGQIQQQIAQLAAARPPIEAKLQQVSDFASQLVP